MTDAVDVAVGLLWHGRGARESFVFSSLREALQDAVQFVVPDWDFSSRDNGRAALLESLANARDSADHLATPLIVVGWSLGGTAALSLANADSSLPGIDAVVGLAADVGARSPIDGTVPAGMGAARCPIYLVHGHKDQVVPAEPTIDFARRHPQIELTLVDTDHAGVIGTAYDPLTGRCNPSSNAAAIAGLSAATATFARTIR